jgi:RNA polymerase sigma factor (sigma-70 family)
MVSAAAKGDRAGWEALVQRYSGLVWAVTRGYRLSPADSADVFQTTWLRLTEHLDRIEKPGQVGSWLATTARRESLRVARSSTRTVPADEATLVALGQSDDYSPEQAVLDAEGALLASERAARLWRAFGHGRAAAELCGGVRGARHPGGQHRADPGALPAAPPRTAGRPGSQIRL